MPFTSTGISGVYSSSNWPPFTEGKNSILNWVFTFETQSFKPKSKNVIETVYTILEESLSYSFFTFRSHQRYKKSVQKEIRDLKKEMIRSPNDAWNGYLKIWGLEPPAARVNVLTHIGSFPTAIKLNPLWKVSKMLR